jgi:hypothetical protein
MTHSAPRATTMPHLFARTACLVTALTLSLISILGAGSPTPAAQMGSAQAESEARSLVLWTGPPPSDESGWVGLHGMAGGIVGLIPQDSPALQNPAARVLETYQGPDAYLLVAPSTADSLARGVLPASWEAPADRLGMARPWAEASPSARVLARDAAQALVALPVAMRGVALEPGCRSQLLTSPERAALALATAARNAGRSARPGAEQNADSNWARTDLIQPPEFWQSLVLATNTDRFLADEDYLSTQLRTRYYSTSQLNDACQYVYNQFAALGLTTSFDPYTYNGRSLKNVLGVKLGTVDPTRIYIVEGHLDSTSPSPTTLAPGADDNASGSCAVLEAARLLAGLPSDYTIYFLCVTAEEQGLIGSEHFAAEADAQNLDIRGVLNMDMVSYHDPAGQDLWLEGFHQGVSSVWLMNQVSSNARTYAGLSVYIYPGEGWGSDHEPFHSHGFSAILSIENEWDSYPCYHRTCDTVDWVNPWLWSRITAANAITAGQLAQVQGALGSISGTVIISGGGDPSGATVRLTGTGYANQTSNGAGLFGWSGILPGSYLLTASKPGYPDVSQNVVVSSGDTTTVQVVFAPPQPGTVRGTVRLADGTPLSGARIEIEGQAAVATSAMLGTYTLSPVLPGTINLGATAPSLIPRGTSVSLTQGQTIDGVDFVMEPVWTFEANSEGLISSQGWAWGADAAIGAHSGSRVWGTVLGANYATCADYRLDLPPISLSPYVVADLRVWMSFRSENGHDGGNVQISTDGGTSWTVLQPQGGYNGTLSGSCNILAGQPGFTGNSLGWAERKFPLDAYVGRWVRLRFHFASDSGTQGLGWYLDDLVVEGSSSSVSVEDGMAEPRIDGRSTGLVLRSLPNPTTGSTEIRLVLPKAENGTLAVYGADGRRLVVLMPYGALSIGEHRVEWNGMDARGRAVPSGIWWLRYEGDGHAMTRALTVIR